MKIVTFAAFALMIASLPFQSIASNMLRLTANEQVSEAATQNAQQPAVGGDANQTDRSPEADPAAILAKVKKVYAQHCCFEAKFDQLSVNVAMDMQDKFKGVMFVKKPNLLAMEVESPERQRVVIRGRSFCVYFPDEGQAARGEVPPEMNVEHFFSFFGGLDKVDENFVVSYPRRSSSSGTDLIFLELTDRENRRSTYRILLGVDKKTYVIRRALITDALGNYNRFDLSDVRFLDSLPDEKFRMDYGKPKHGSSLSPMDLPRKGGDSKHGTQSAPKPSK